MLPPAPNWSHSPATRAVNQATWSQDESKILTSSDDDTARIWDAATGAELVTLAGHTGCVWQATWSQDESKILTAATTTPPASGMPPPAPNWSRSPATRMGSLQATWSQDESKILTRSDDDTARIWDAATGAELVKLAGHTDRVNAGDVEPG